MNISLFQGPPNNIDDRLEKEKMVYNLLDELQISYQRTDHEEAMTMEICTEIEKVLNAPICKNLFLCNRQKTKFYLLLMPGDKPFKTKDISKQINSARLSFASDEDLLKYLHLTPGSCTVFGLIFDKELNVQLVIDQDVLNQQLFGCHPCMNTSTISFKTSDLINKVLPYLKHSYITVTL